MHTHAYTYICRCMQHYVYIYIHTWNTSSIPEMLAFSGARNSATRLLLKHQCLKVLHQPDSIAKAEIVSDDPSCQKGSTPGLRLQLYRYYLHWGLKYLNRTHLGLFGVPSSCGLGTGGRYLDPLPEHPSTSVMRTQLFQVFTPRNLHTRVVEGLPRPSGTENLGRHLARWPRRWRGKLWMPSSLKDALTAQ